MSINFKQPIGEFVFSEERFGIWAQDTEGRWDYLDSDSSLVDAKAKLTVIKDEHSKNTRESSEYWRYVITDTFLS